MPKVAPSAFWRDLRREVFWLVASPAVTLFAAIQIGHPFFWFALGLLIGLDGVLVMALWTKHILQEIRDDA